MPRLIVRAPGRGTTSMTLWHGFRVGRDDQCSLVLSDPQVSRQHIEFLRSGAGYSVRDMGSTFGVLVNDQPRQSHELESGDEIRIGGVELTYVASEEGIEVLHHQISTTGVRGSGGVESAITRRLDLIYQVSRAIGALDHVHEMLGRMLEAILEVQQCERGVVGLIGWRDRGRRIERVRGADADVSAEVVISSTLLEAVIDKGEGIIVRNDPEHNPPTSLIQQRILCAMGVPLQTADGVVLGFLYVDDRGRRDRFSVDDLEFLTALGHLTAAALQSARQYQRAAATAESLVEEPSDIIGESEPLQQLERELQKCAAGDPGVLIRGESGSGKELVACRLHALSPRSEEVFISLNCAAIPDTMVESELFGHVEGAFTGAIRDKRGKFALADGGTLFLDEIGDLSLAAQAKVLRAIEHGEVTPVGSEATLRVDVRILAATHKDLREEIAAGRFREDLYYRLNVLEIEVPPLRRRGADISLLAEAFLQRARERTGKTIRGITQAAHDVLCRYAWPGNVRELQNEIERAAIITDGPWIDIEDLTARVVAVDETRPTLSGKLTAAQRFAELEDTERALVREAFEKADGNVSKAARILGITRIMFKRRMERFGIGKRGSS